MLSHPMIVEAAETAFVPAAAYNNTEGDADAALRESFEEPAWNYPVVRILDAERRDLVPRFHEGFQLAGLASSMRLGLERAGSAVPTWFGDFEQELDARRRGVASAVFGMT